MMMWLVGNQNFGNTVEEFWTISIFFFGVEFLFFSVGVCLWLDMLLLMREYTRRACALWVGVYSSGGSPPARYSPLNFLGSKADFFLSRSYWFDLALVVLFASYGAALFELS